MNNPIKSGYTFAGWTGTNLTAATKTVIIKKGTTGALSYTATWKKNNVGGGGSSGGRSVAGGTAGGSGIVPITPATPT